MTPPRYDRIGHSKWCTQPQDADKATLDKQKVAHNYTCRYALCRSFFIIAQKDFRDSFKTVEQWMFPSIVIPDKRKLTILTSRLLLCWHCLKIVSQQSLKSLSKVSQKSLKSLSKFSQKSLKSLSKVSQKSLKSLSKVFKSLAENVDFFFEMPNIGFFGKSGICEISTFNALIALTATFLRSEANFPFLNSIIIHCWDIDRWWKDERIKKGLIGQTPCSVLCPL